MGISGDTTFRRLGAAYMDVQLKKLRARLGGARDAEDVECVHDVRVATRRLRAALRMFRGSLPRKKSSRWRRGIRKLTNGLGRARDLDVKADFLRGFLRGGLAPPLRPGLRRLLLRVEQDRAALQPAVRRRVQRFADGGVLSELRQDLATWRRGGDAGAEHMLRQCQRHIQRCLRRLLERQDCLDDPNDLAGHHGLRIAAKRFRYTLEICAPAYGAGPDSAPSVLTPYIGEVRLVQSNLGDLHDCDLWGGYLDRFLEDEARRTASYFGHERPMPRLRLGIEHLQAERREARAALFEQLRAYWQELRSRSFWESLIGVLALPAFPPAEARSATDAPELAPAPETAEAPTPAPNADEAAVPPALPGPESTDAA